MQLLRLCEVATQPEQYREIVQTVRGGGILPAQGALLNRERTPVHCLHVGGRTPKSGAQARARARIRSTDTLILVQLLQHVCEIIQTGRDIRMITAEELLTHRKRTPVHRLRLRVLALQIQHVAEIGERSCGARMLAQRLLVDYDHLMMQGLGFLKFAAALCFLGAQRDRGRRVGCAPGWRGRALSPTPAELALCIEYTCEIRNRGRCVRVVTPEFRLQYPDRATQQALRTAEIAKLFQYKRKTVQCRSRVLVVRAQTALVDREHAAKQTFRFAEASQAEQGRTEEVQPRCHVRMFVPVDSRALGNQCLACGFSPGIVAAFKRALRLLLQFPDAGLVRKRRPTGCRTHGRGRAVCRRLRCGTRRARRTRCGLRECAERKRAQANRQDDGQDTGQHPKIIGVQVRETG